jgi:dTDP-4-amino-4,6-dideoxygalactose transaminase
MKKVPVFLPDLGIDTIRHLSETLEIGWLGMGAKTKEFEECISEFLELDGRFVIATNTATSALHLALLAIGVGKGDEVITPSFNCVADQQAIKMTGAEPVMCDILEKNLGIDCKKAEELISEKTKAIVPLHYSGIPCNQKEVYDLAKKYNLRVIEDCCHAFGTSINNKKLGSFGDIAFFSFDAVKTLTSIDGGCVIVKDEEEFKKIQYMRLLGMDKDTLERYKNKRSWNYDVITQGYRYHLNNVMATVGISQIKRINEIIDSRRKVCQLYNDAFKNLSGIETPESDFKNISSFNYYIRVKDNRREELIEYLKTLEIETGIHWTPVHKFSFFSESKRGDLVVTEKIANEILTLPLHSNMKQEFIERVIHGITSFFK